MRALLKNTHIRDNVAFLMIALAAYLTVPTIVHAEIAEEDVLSFTQPLPLTRGSFSPGGPDSLYLTHKGSCVALQERLGWKEQQCSTIENVAASYSSEVDTIIIGKPDSGGYVRFDDWDGDDRDEAIASIWDEMVLGVKEQSKALGEKIEMDRWLLYPTLDKVSNTLVYAYSIRWNGELLINMRASVFDRKGYIPFMIVPTSSDLTVAELQALTRKVVAGYVPRGGESYASFTSGDKVAAIGAVGVLASLMGVKYGKAAGLGIAAIILAFAKKAWIFLVMPFVWILKRLRKSKAKT